MVVESVTVSVVVVMSSVAFVMRDVLMFVVLVLVVLVLVVLIFVDLFRTTTSYWGNILLGRGTGMGWAC